MGVFRARIAFGNCYRSWAKCWPHGSTSTLAAGHGVHQLSPKVPPQCFDLCRVPCRCVVFSSTAEHELMFSRRACANTIPHSRAGLSSALRGSTLRGGASGLSSWCSSLPWRPRGKAPRAGAGDDGDPVRLVWHRGLVPTNAHDNMLDEVRAQVVVHPRDGLDLAQPETNALSAKLGQHLIDEGFWPRL